MSDAYDFRPGGSLKLKGDKDKKWVEYNEIDLLIREPKH